MHFHPGYMDNHMVMLAIRAIGGRPVPLASVAVLVRGLGRHAATAAWTTAGPYRNPGHSFYEVLSGEAAIAIDGRWQQLRPGRLYAIPGHRQVQRRTRGFVHLHADFNLGSFTDDLHLGRLDRVLEIVLTESKPWSQALHRACTCGIAGLPSQPVAALALEGTLLGVVAAMRSAAPPGPPLPPRDGPVATALAFLDRHYLRMPSLAETAHAAGRSPAHLHACFSAAIGRTPAAYALDRRMGEAHQLLTATALPVAVVAERCGYADPLYFSRVVRQHFGRSPRQLRALRVG